MGGLTVAYDARLPHARWGALFHVFRLERRDVALAWRAVDFLPPGRSMLAGWSASAAAICWAAITRPPGVCRMI